MAQKLLIQAALAIGMLSSRGCMEPDAKIEPEVPIEPAAAKALDDVLSRWEKKSAEIQSVDAKFKRKDSARVFGRETNDDGHFLSKGKDYATLIFSQKEEGEAAKVDQILLFTPTEFHHYRSSLKSVTVLALSEKFDQPFTEAIPIPLLGSLPMFLSIRVEKAKAEYQIRIVEEREHQYVLSFVPRKRSWWSDFTKVHVLLNKETLLPDALKFFSAGENNTRLFVYSEIKTNVPIESKWFEPRKIPKDWRELRMDPQPPMQQKQPEK